MIEVVARHGQVEVARFTLPHGADPGAQVRARGWTPESVAVTGRAPAVVLAYAVSPGPVVPAPVLPGTPDAVTGEIRYAVRHTGPGGGAPQRRLAAYALVVADDRVLLTQLSQRIPDVGGDWLLPGGGIDPGETPAQAVAREVWEETGQAITGATLVAVRSLWRFGPSPDPRWSTNFHAIRLIHTATCAAPVEPVVHDVGGSTAATRWVPWAQRLDLPLVPWARLVLTGDLRP